MSSHATTYVPVPSSGPANAVPIATPVFNMAAHGRQHSQQDIHDGSGSTYVNNHMMQNPENAPRFSSVGSSTPGLGQLALPEYNPGDFNNSQSSSSMQSAPPLTASTNLAAKSSKRAIQSCSECKISLLASYLYTSSRLTVLCVLVLTGGKSNAGNRVYPCSPCIVRGEGDACREVEKVELIPMPVPTMMDFEASCARITALEESIQNLYSYIHTAGLHRGNGISRPGSAQGFIGTHRNLLLEGRGHHDSEPVADKEPEDMAMMLEDFAMGHKANQDRASKLISGQNAAQAITQNAGQSPILQQNIGQEDQSQYLSTVASTAIPPLALEHPLSSIINPEADYMAKFLAMAPDPFRGGQLVRFYFDHLEWYTRVLHAPTFMDECKHFLSLPTEVASRKVRPSFLATYFMVLCLALQFIEPGERDRLGWTAEQATSIRKNMFSASQSLLWLCDFMGVHSLEHLQCVVMMGTYQYNVGMADSHWALSGSAIKIAQNIGLSRLGRENSQQRWPEGWRDPLKREIGRRVWWHLIFLDWSHATAHNSCYSIHPSQNFTDFPANVDDESLEAGTPFVPKPLEHHTDTSFTICRLKFVALYRELLDYQLAHNPPNYSYILEMDARIVKVLDNLPAYFRGSTPPSDRLNDPLVMECLLIQLIGETRLLRLHRPYLSRGYKDRKYAPSKDRCVHSARSISVLLKTAERACPLLLGQWLVLFYGFGSGIVTFIDLCNSKRNNEDANIRQKRQDLREMLQVLQRAKSISDAAMNATALLEGLLAAEEEVALSTDEAAGSAQMIGHKRKASDMDVGDPFKRVVKKLLVEAASGVAAKPSQVTGPSPTPSRFSGGSPTNGPMPQNPSPRQASSVPSVSSYIPVNGASYPELDIFTDSHRAFSQYGRDTGSDLIVDPTQADLSHLFMDDFMSNFFSDSNLSGGLDPLLSNGW